MCEWIDLIEVIGKTEGNISAEAFYMFIATLIFLAYIIKRITKIVITDTKEGVE